MIKNSYQNVLLYMYFLFDVNVSVYIVINQSQMFLSVVWEEGIELL